MPRDTILEKITREKPYLAQKYNVTELGLFGSFVRGEEKETSDIDILVNFDENNPPSLYEVLGMQDHLEDVLGKKVDLVHKKMLKEDLRKNILSEAIYV